MILGNQHRLEIVVNGEPLEFVSDDDLNLVFKTSVFNPTDIETKQTEYSYQITFPCNDKNNRILGYANNLSVLNKFNKRYNAQVFGDGILLFDGTMALSGIEDGNYQANLVSIKVYSLEDIFGEHTLYDLDWYVTFHGAPTINEVNQNDNHQYYFPFVSYGVFQKKPYYQDTVANDYTSKFLIDNWNRFYYSSFPPSFNPLAVTKKCFEQYGYNVGGTAYADKILNNIYMSTNITSDQIPQYNIGHPRFGSLNISISGRTSGRGINQELDYPTVLVGNMYPDNVKVKGADYETYDWRYINVYDCLDSSSTVTHYTNSYLFDTDDSVIIVPSDGFYEIHMEATATLVNTSITAFHYYTDKFVSASTSAQTTEVAETRWNAPIEFQVVKNYDATNSNIELIHGSKHQIRWTYDNKDVQTETVITDYPHQALGDSLLVFRPTKAVDETTNSGVLGGRNERPTSGVSRGDSSDKDGSFRGSGGSRTSQGRTSAVDSVDRQRESATDMGYVHTDTHCFDAMINQDFICGLSSIGDGTSSTIKNGYSCWRQYTPKVENFYRCSGYKHREKTDEGTFSRATDVNENQYANSPKNVCNTTSQRMNGAVTCCVWLNRNDVISIKAIQRYYEGNQPNYSYNYQINFKLKAISPNNYDYLKALPIEYGMDSQFDVQLRLGNFLSSSTTMVSFIESVKNAFNLDIIQEGKNIYINTQNYKWNQKDKAAIDIDNRVDSANIKASIIDYPSSFSVQYKTDKDEWGYEQSVPREYINLDNWFEYGDSGYSIISLSEINDSEKKVTLPFSYTWYDIFNLQDRTDSSITTPLSIPVLSKTEYMIDGYNYEEAMQHDGMSLSQRMWFRQERSENTITLASKPMEMVYLSLPSNSYMGVNLSYKNSEKSILTEYFNIISAPESNFIDLDCYLNSEEYQKVKMGTLLHFDSDLYIPCDIQYRASNGDTTLKLMKK